MARRPLTRTHTVAATKTRTHTAGEWEQVWGRRRGDTASGAERGVESPPLHHRCHSSCHCWITQTLPRQRSNHSPPWGAQHSTHGTGVTHSRGDRTRCVSAAQRGVTPPSNAMSHTPATACGSTPAQPAAGCDPVSLPPRLFALWRALIPGCLPLQAWQREWRRAS